jgi:cyclic-di-GMP-binding biofilm dispersal mediator protein
MWPVRNAYQHIPASTTVSHLRALSKAALRAFDEGLAREARRKGVRVIDARPPHTETGLAGRAIAGTAPKMGGGLEPAVVARVICDGIESGATDLGSPAFVV